MPAPKQHFTKGDKEILEQNAVPADWRPAKRRQKDRDASWTRKHGKSHHGHKVTVSVDRKHKLVRNRMPIRPGSTTLSIWHGGGPGRVEYQ